MSENRIPDLGVNSASVKYEVALEIIGQSRQPILRAINEERARGEAGSPVRISYLQARLTAIDNLQETLEPTDTETINLILDKDSRHTWL